MVPLIRVLAKEGLGYSSASVLLELAMMRMETDCVCHLRSQEDQAFKSPVSLSPLPITDVEDTLLGIAVS